MDHEFTTEEIKDAARAARIYCPGFSEDMFASLMELERHVADSGYLEAVSGLIRLKEERGISCTDSLDACKELIKEKAKLELEVPALEKRVESLVSQIKQFSAEYEQVKQTSIKAGQVLAQIRAEYTAAEKKLEAFNKKMEKEKQHIEKEVEDYYQQSNVTKEEVVTAGKIKAEVEGHGFTLELMLGLSREFAGHENVREKLSQALKEHDSLKKYLNDLAVWGDKEKARILGEITSLESEKVTMAGVSVHLKNVLSQLQADAKVEKELRLFHQRYSAASSLLEHLASWSQIFFLRCTNPAFMITGAFDANSGNARFWTDKPVLMCPQCGYRHIVYDERVYQALN
ncbi:MAG: hypothetical protein Q7J73_02955, partial [Dehalococcoidales bacterium]|nr:hypothetical protein [Dehalococcoidales bacterium]